MRSSPLSVLGWRSRVSSPVLRLFPWAEIQFFAELEKFIPARKITECALMANSILENPEDAHLPGSLLFLPPAPVDLTGILGSLPPQKSLHVHLKPPDLQTFMAAGEGWVRNRTDHFIPVAGTGRSLSGKTLPGQPHAYIDE